VIVVHSQGGNFAFKAALKAPDKIKAIVAVEPSGSPDPAKTDLSALKSIPHLFVWGDRLDESPFWTSVSGQLSKYHQAVAQQGGVADWMSLPQAGIKGNSHMLMMDRNADQIAQRIQTWMSQQGLMK
jgi:pimeloyl-ACP methyl ester carboxylesterase